jgi:hypothetical protein
MVSAGAVSCARPGPIGPVAGSRAAPQPNEPELTKIAARARDAQRALCPCVHERTHGRAIRTNPSCLESQTNPTPAGLAAFPAHAASSEPGQASARSGFGDQFAPKKEARGLTAPGPQAWEEEG